MASSVHTIVAHYFLNHGTEAQKQRYLPRMARGELVGAIAMTEPGAGSDLQGVRTRAEKQADGSWKVSDDITSAGEAKEVPPAKPAQHAKMVSFG